MTRYQQELTVGPESLGRVRRIVAALLRHWRLGALADSALVCVTELLANVSRHVVPGECVLLLEDTSSGVRIVVSDSSARLPVVREPDWSAESGRGMLLISTVAARWGATPTCEGKDVWVELREDAS